MFRVDVEKTIETAEEALLVGFPALLVLELIPRKAIETAASVPNKGLL